ncbi:MAG: hypothetical protein K8S55_05860 [Phycisphaerae bacterium]|nr:hypothetical protein [Phycisphaerae bacterium]
MKLGNTHYRAASWWITWADLEWPDEELVTKIKRRADTAAETGVNCFVIFGAHFRWDYLPFWTRLHDMFAVIADELRQRDIQLFDHHSSVLTHRPRNSDDAWSVWKRNRHHVPFYPSMDVAATWTFEGQLLNDWRMIDVETDEPCFLEFYTAEQFCMNNPHFRKAYQSYVKRLVAETGVSGLMSDDAIFYDGWRVCGCQWCRQRFQNEYGHALPPTTDLSFWGNRDSEAFKDWIDMRFRSSADFLGVVQEVLPPDFPLMACCSSSDSSGASASGMTYQGFIKNSNMVMLEMCGSTPSLQGTWDERIASQLLHLSIARDNHCPCFGLGYGFSREPAFFIWALNKFLGSDTWFSTLKGRLGMPNSETAELPDDPELVGEGFTWEKKYPHLFQGKADTRTAVLFSRGTRDYYGQIHEDYVRDYHDTCNVLMKSKLNFEVVTDIPAVEDWGILVMSSVMCLSKEQREKLLEYMTGGGIVVATGPLGSRDERARLLEDFWLETHGLEATINEPQRHGAFPPYTNTEAEIAECMISHKGQRIEDGQWVDIKIGDGRLLWCPNRMGDDTRQPALAEIVENNETHEDYRVTRSPEEWYLRSFRDGGRILFHGLPSQVATEAHPVLRKRYIAHDEEIVDRIHYKELAAASLAMEFTETPVAISVYSPDLAEPRVIKPETTGKTNAIEIDLSGIKRYFVVEVTLAGHPAGGISQPL